MKESVGRWRRGEVEEARREVEAGEGPVEPHHRAPRRTRRREDPMSRGGGGGRRRSLAGI